MSSPTSKYETLKKVLDWCKHHPNRDFFFYYEVDSHQRSVASLCDSVYRNKTWLVRKGIHKSKDCNNSLVKYALNGKYDNVIRGTIFETPE